MPSADPASWAYRTTQHRVTQSYIKRVFSIILIPGPCNVAKAFCPLLVSTPRNMYVTLKKIQKGKLSAHELCWPYKTASTSMPIQAVLVLPPKKIGRPGVAVHALQGWLNPGREWPIAGWKRRAELQHPCKLIRRKSRTFTFVNRNEVSLGNRSRWQGRASRYWDCIPMRGGKLASL